MSFLIYVQYDQHRKNWKPWCSGLATMGGFVLPSNVVKFSRWETRLYNTGNTKSMTGTQNSCVPFTLSIGCECRMWLAQWSWTILETFFAPPFLRSATFSPQDRVQVSHNNVNATLHTCLLMFWSSFGVKAKNDNLLKRILLHMSTRAVKMTNNHPLLTNHVSRFTLTIHVNSIGRHELNSKRRWTIDDGVELNAIKSEYWVSSVKWEMAQHAGANRCEPNDLSKICGR